MGKPHVAKEFMQKHLPPALLAHMQLDTLQPQIQSFIDANFKAQEAGRDLQRENTRYLGLYLHAVRTPKQTR